MNAETTTNALAALPVAAEPETEPAPAPPKRESGAQKKNRLRKASPPPPLAEDAPVLRGRPRP